MKTPGFRFETLDDGDFSILTKSKDEKESLHFAHLDKRRGHVLRAVWNK